MNNERFTPFVLIIERITKNIKRIADLEMEQYGLRSSHVMCILQLAKSEGGLSSSALADACGVDKAFISRTTSDLVKGGFIETNQKYEDGRKYRLKYILTEKGKFVLHETKKTVEHYFSELGNKIGEYEMNSFMRVIGMIDELAHKDQAEA